MQPKRISLNILLALLAIVSIKSMALAVDLSAPQKLTAATILAIPITDGPITDGSAVAMAGAVSHSTSAPSQDPVRSAIVKILNDRTLFGRDFPAALAFLSSWSQIGEREVHIYPDRIVGATQYKTLEEAQQAADRLRQATAGPRPTPSPEFVELLRGVPSQFPFRVEVISFFSDDGSIRLAWSAPQASPGVSQQVSDPAQTALQFFDPGLTPATVQQRAGPADEITQRTLQTDKDERPVILAVHSYAKGAVVFATSDLSPRPGSVDRIIFNVPAITAVVFVGGPSVR